MPLVRFAGDSGRCHQRDLLRATGGGRIDDGGAARAAGSDRARRNFLRAVQRPRQSLLLDTSCGKVNQRRPTQVGRAGLASIHPPLKTEGFKPFPPLLALESSETAATRRINLTLPSTTHRIPEIFSSQAQIHRR